jgi:hypothetical protein
METLSLARAMETKGAKLPAFESFEVMEETLQADGKALSALGRGHYKAIAAFVTAYSLSNSVSLNMVADTLNGVWVTVFGDAQEQKSAKSKVLWACREAFTVLKSDIDEGTDDNDAIACALAHFQQWPMFAEYNARNDGKKTDAKGEGEGEGEGKAETVPAGDVAIKAMGAIEVAHVAQIALERLLFLAQEDEGARQLAEKLVRDTEATCKAIFAKQVEQVQEQRKAA